MVSFDCYCAICAGPLGASSVKFGSKDPITLARRRKHVHGERYELTENIAKSVEPSDGKQVSEDWEVELNEEYSYDPEVIREAEIAWTESCRCIGFNAEASGVSKCFISGSGFIDDYGSFDVLEPSGDPNDLENGYYDCYSSMESGDSAAFPFHELCYDLLAHYINGSPKSKKLDMDVMYSTLSYLYGSEREGYLSNVDYGLPNVVEQFWTCKPGEEWTVCDFSTREDLTNSLREIIIAMDFTTSSSALDFGAKVQCDPFIELSYDVLCLIFPHLDKESSFSLMKASWHVLSSTQNDNFWKQLIRHNMLPWFWELAPILDAGVPDGINYKRLFLWLDNLTKGTYGMEGRLIAVANRKRIWSTCSQIAEVYQRILFKKVKQSGEEYENEEAEAILRVSSSSYLQIVSLPITQSAETVTRQFIRSWDEIEHEPCCFESCWNSHGALVGLSVTFGDSRRTIGETSDGKNGHFCYLARIPPNEWIREVELGVSNVDIFGGKDTRAFVVSVTLNLTSGEEQFTMKGPRSDVSIAHVRGLVVSSNGHLTGFVGRIAQDGVITRLGLLQASHPSVTNLETPATPFAQTLLWDSISAYLPGRVPIWNHARMDGFPVCSQLETKIHYDMIPHHALLWAYDVSQLRSLKRLSAYVLESGMVEVVNYGGQWRDQPIVDILAFRTEFHELESAGAKQYETAIIGYPPKQRPDDGSPSGRDSFDEESWVQFEIDGPGGERITQVHVAEGSRAIILRTNRGRACNWGEANPDQFIQLEVPEGEVIIGLVVAFGKPSGYDFRKETWNHLESTAINVLTMALEDGFDSQ